MSVSLRVTGAWAELVADGSVAIPATPQAGDRMYLFARWKDFSVTATVANWTELVEFADGAVGTGNGTGSVKVGCWYRDWQSGDTDPAIDFSAAPENASVVIMVMAKGANDVWLTPVAVSAAMTNWTTTSQIVSASSTVVVKSDGVVMGLIGIRDDTATMTRPSTGIDDSAGVVTWNGNYVESPATHHSTTTGDDGAADLGYRLVAIGTTATLRMTGTISAAETGAALWVVQGISVVITPGIASLTSARFAPSLRVTTTPAQVTLVTTAFAPKLETRLTPAIIALSLTTFALVLNRINGPSVAVLTLGSFAPNLHEQTIPLVANLSLTSFAPAATVLTFVTPATVDLVITSFSVELNSSIVIPSLTLTLTGFIPITQPPQIVFLDPGGDAVQAAEYFNTPIAGSSGAIAFDPTQKVTGVGSYKFDSEAGVTSGVSVSDVLGGTTGSARRISAYFRYDSVPDATQVASEFVEDNAVYSGGGFTDPANTSVDDGFYATATPAKNSGQGSKCSVISPLNIPSGAIIDSVKIIYERKYDTDTSIGISRVKWVVDEEEGPDHDNTDQPLTDTVVEVDVTADRSWEWQHFQAGRLEVIAEARRGDTDTAHTQSWDYVKVEVQYHVPTVIMQGRQFSTLGFRASITPKDDGVVLRLADDADNAYDGITKLLPDTWLRIAVCYALVAENEIGIKLYMDSIEELSIIAAIANPEDWPLHLDFGWVRNPGTDHLCWFDQLYIDEGDDLSDPGDMRSTAKLPDAVNEDNWDTTGGTGAVDERPLSETNYMQHAAAFSPARQTYTLQAADEGDVDLTGETLVGCMGWVWAKVGGGEVEEVYLVFNGADIFIPIGLTPGFFYRPETSVTYPSDSAAIGMVANASFADTFLYECGVIVAYEGPNASPNRLLARRLVDNETLSTIIDDLRADPPDSYEVCCLFEDFGGTVEIVIHSLDQDGGSVQFQGTLNATGRVRITPGVEVRLDVTVTGVTMLQIWRRINID